MLNGLSALFRFLECFFFFHFFGTWNSHQSPWTLNRHKLLRGISSACLDGHTAVSQVVAEDV